MSNQNRQIYIVISQTGTLLSRILKQITGAEYNHASISLSRDLERMYSFGRRHPYNPFWGGFVIESPRTGTFKRFSETKVLVLSVSVTEEQHAELKEMLDVMWKRRRKYGYNYIGLCLAYFHIVWKQEGCYYCSEFVGELLTKSRVDGTEQLCSSSNEVVCEMHEDGKQQVPFLLVKDSCGNAHKGGIGSLHDIQVINAEEYR